MQKWHCHIYCGCLFLHIGAYMTVMFENLLDMELRMENSALVVRRSNMFVKRFTLVVGTDT